MFTATILRATKQYHGSLLASLPADVLWGSFVTRLRGG